MEKPEQTTAIAFSSLNKKEGMSKRMVKSFQKFPWVLRMIRTLYRPIYPLLHWCIRTVCLTYLACEYAVLASLQASALKKADYVFPMWFYSFGHQAAEPHILAMRFSGKKLTVLVDDYRNFNPYIVDSFREFLNLRYLRHSRLSAKLLPFLKVKTVKTMEKKVLAVILTLIRSRAQIVPEFHERDGSSLEGHYLTEYMGLMRAHADMIIRPPADLIAHCSSAFFQRFPEWKGRWMVALYLRRKRHGAPEIRDTPPETYKKAVQMILSRGGMVFCGGDYDPAEIFPDLPQVIGYRQLPFDRKKADTFFLSQSAFFLGGHSGPPAICFAYNVPTLITNNALFYLSGLRERGIVIFKSLKEKTSARILTAQDTFSLPVIGFDSPRQFLEKGLVHVDNTAEDIAAATEEMIARVIDAKNPATEADEELLRRFRDLLPKECVLYQSACRPGMAYLRSLVW